MPLFYARRCSDSDTAPGQPADACTRTRTHIYFTRRAGPLQLQLQRQMHRGCLPGLVCLGLLPCLPARLCVVRLGLAARIQTAKLTLCDEAIDTRHEAQPSPWPASCAARRDITMYPSIHVCMYVYLACIAIGPAVRGIDSRHVPILPPAPRTTRGHCMVPTCVQTYVHDDAIRLTWTRVQHPLERRTPPPPVSGKVSHAERPAPWNSGRIRLVPHGSRPAPWPFQVPSAGQARAQNSC